MDDNPDDIPQPAEPQEPQVVRELDPFKVQELQERLHSEQNLLLGIIAGLVAALIGAAIWAAITFIADLQIGWMAIGLGFLVGWAIQYFGKGVDRVFGFLGGGLALLACLAGNLFMLAAFIAQEESAAFIDVLAFMILNPAADLELLVATFSPIDLLFYALAAYYGYKYAFRQVTQAEQEGLYRTRTIMP